MIVYFMKCKWHWLWPQVICLPLFHKRKTNKTTHSFKAAPGCSCKSCVVWTQWQITFRNPTRSGIQKDPTLDLIRAPHYGWQQSSLLQNTHDHAWPQGLLDTLCTRRLWPRKVGIHLFCGASLPAFQSKSASQNVSSSQHQMKLTEGYWQWVLTMLDLITYAP